MRALDLFCGAGGATMGMRAAGFEVTGVDQVARRPDRSLKNPMADKVIICDVRRLAAEFLMEFDFVWASPPCQKFSAARRISPSKKPTVNLIPLTRLLIEKSGVPGVIENVPAAPLRKDFVLTGPMVGEPGMVRKRVFEFVNMPPPPPAVEICARAADIVSLSGNSAPMAPKVTKSYEKFNAMPRAEQLAWKQRAIGAPWMNWHECNDAVPARYAFLIARHAMEHLLGGALRPLPHGGGGG